MEYLKGRVSAQKQNKKLKKEKRISVYSIRSLVFDISFKCKMHLQIYNKVFQQNTNIQFHIKKLKKKIRLHRKDKHSVLLFSLYYTDHKYLFLYIGLRADVFFMV